MSRLRLACYNIAWFSRLFDRTNHLIEDDAPSAIAGVTRARQAEAIAQVLRRVDADCYAIIEAPNTGRHQSCVEQLEHFAERFELRQSAALTGFESETRQEIALLFDPARIAAEHAPIDGGEAAPRFDHTFVADLDGDGLATPHVFSKPPLEALVSDHATGVTFRMIAVHLKSKRPGRTGNEAERYRSSLESRAKQIAQATWVRARLETHLDAGEPVVTLGDFNDGPGMDPLEQTNGASSVEVVTGPRERPDRLLVHPFNGVRSQEQQATATARFHDESSGSHADALLDFVMLSPALAAHTRPVWQTWHPFQDSKCAGEPMLRQALLDASDHFPVSVDLTFSGN